MFKAGGNLLSTEPRESTLTCCLPARGDDLQGERERRPHRGPSAPLPRGRRQPIAPSQLVVTWGFPIEFATRSRWLVTFSFGLTHGLGFAAILKEMAISRGNLALSLVSFNFGVELGQIAVVTTAFLGLQALATLAWESALRRWVSAGAAAIGIIWFIQRAFLA